MISRLAPRSKAPSAQLSSAESSSGSGRSKPHVSQACDSCQLKRCKCDKETPCAACTKTGTLCQRTHDDKRTAGKRGPDHSSQELSTLPLPITEFSNTNPVISVEPSSQEPMPPRLSLAISRRSGQRLHLSTSLSGKAIASSQYTLDMPGEIWIEPQMRIALLRYYLEHSGAEFSPVASLVVDELTYSTFPASRPDNHSPHPVFSPRLYYCLMALACLPAKNPAMLSNSKSAAFTRLVKRDMEALLLERPSLAGILALSAVAILHASVAESGTSNSYLATSIRMAKSFQIQLDHVDNSLSAEEENGRDAVRRVVFMVHQLLSLWWTTVDLKEWPASMAFIDGPDAHHSPPHRSLYTLLQSLTKVVAVLECIEPLKSPGLLNNLRAELEPWRTTTCPLDTCELKTVALVYASLIANLLQMLPEDIVQTIAIITGAQILAVHPFPGTVRQIIRLLRWWRTNDEGCRYFSPTLGMIVLRIGEAGVHWPHLFTTPGEEFSIDSSGSPLQNPAKPCLNMLLEYGQNFPMARSYAVDLQMKLSDPRLYGTAAPLSFDSLMPATNIDGVVSGTSNGSLSAGTTGFGGPSEMTPFGVASFPDVFDRGLMHGWQ